MCNQAQEGGGSMPTAITHVQPGSIAERLGLAEGDQLLSIAGEPIIDQIDYQALTANRRFEMAVMKKDGSQVTLHVRKQDWEPLGITLDQSIVSSPRPCQNHCIFCFIDQMPPGMRKTLYVKDDDWRLSLMMGNYITMTNIDDMELDRIIRRKVSPLFISVHCTNPDMRVKLLRNPRAALIMDKLRLLREHGIRFHCQIVLCPGWNDGEILFESIRELAQLAPAAQSVALVPIGLTKYREGLPYIKPYDRQMARELIESVKPLQAKFLTEMGTRFVFPADEFFCLSGLPLPEDEEYEDYPQIENGVGMLRMFETDLRYAAEDEPVSETPPRRLCIATGTSVAPFLQRLADEYAPKGTTVEVRAIVNRFFGETVTVAGLITGRDLVEQCRDVVADEILIVRSMIRAEGDLFLDGMTVEAVRKALPAPLRITESTGEGFWRAISGCQG
ncbi:MAG: DUF512 domain-containing protein [Clostridiales bacterium]|nr:DUF512 domain-containing protein [Clostridiales bacterium]